MTLLYPTKKYWIDWKISSEKWIIYCFPQRKQAQERRVSARIYDDGNNSITQLTNSTGLMNINDRPTNLTMKLAKWWNWEFSTDEWLSCSENAKIAPYSTANMSWLCCVLRFCHYLINQSALAPVVRQISRMGGRS